MSKPARALHASEHQMQCAVIRWWQYAHHSYKLPEFALFAIPNGGARDAVTGALMKAEGVRAGAPDLMLAVPWGPYHDNSGLFIEMKANKNKPTSQQLAFIAYLESAGYKCAVHWSAISAIEEIKAYLA